MEKYEIEIQYVFFNKGFIEIGWIAKNIGFGQLTIYKVEQANKYVFDTEEMSQEFVDAVLSKVFPYIKEHIAV